jgi:hypothetical protein
MRTLHRLLGLMPFEPSPLPVHLTAYGCHQSPCPTDARPFWRRGWARAQALQRTLLAVAGPPGEAVS